MLSFARRPETKLEVLKDLRKAGIDDLFRDIVFTKERTTAGFVHNRLQWWEQNELAWNPKE